MKASIAIQIIPLTDPAKRLPVIESVIAYLQEQAVKQVVTPFETVLEGDWEELFAILKQAIELAGDQAENVFANVKINYGQILSIEEKIETYHS